MVSIYKSDKEELTSRMGLTLTDTESDGYKRRKNKNTFTYYDGTKKIDEDKIIARLNALAVPPSYTDIWYCKQDNGHIQATGQDQTGKKQYFYHAKWRTYQDSFKYRYLAEIADILPSWRRKIRKDLKQEHSNEKKRLLATMGRLLDRTGMRIGNKASAKENKTFGMTTLRKNHIKQVDEHCCTLSYKGKGDVKIERELHDALLCDILQDIIEHHGQDLFTYEDRSGETHQISASTFNSYLKETTNIDEMSAKDLRTWRFSVLFLETLCKLKSKGRKITQSAVLETISEITGNTPAILKESYIHPGLLNMAKNNDLSPLKECMDRKVSGLRKYEAIFKAYLNTRHAATHAAPINI